MVEGSLQDWGHVMKLPDNIAIHCLWKMRSYAGATEDIKQLISCWIASLAVFVAIYIICDSDLTYSLIIQYVVIYMYIWMYIYIINYIQSWYAVYINTLYVYNTLYIPT